MAGTGFTGGRHSEETKAHWRTIRKGIKPSIEAVAKSAHSRYKNAAFRDTILLSPEDEHLRMAYFWAPHNGAYASCQLEGKRIYLHQLIYLAPKGLEIDHINGNPLDNRRGNLRPTTRTQNQMNRKINSNNVSGCKGVVWHSAKHKWCANIRVDKKLIHLGYFNSLEDAVGTRKTAEAEYFKEYARI